MSGALAVGAVDRPLPAARVFSAPWLRRFAVYLLLGLVILCINFPKFLGHTIDLNVADPAWHAVLMAPIQIVQWGVGIVVGSRQAAFFERAIGVSFVLVWLFLAALTILSIRRRSARMLGYCIGGMVVGYLTLHVLAWLAVTIVVVVGAAIFVVGWIASGIYSIAAFLAYYTWPLFVLAILFLIGRNYRRQVLAALRAAVTWLHRHLGRIALAIGGAALAAVLVPVLVRWVIMPLLRFLTPFGQLLWAAGKWIVFVIFVILFAVIAIAVSAIGLALIGSLLVSQLQAGWRAGRSPRDMLVAGFAIGSSLTLIVIVSLATPALSDALNHAWTASFLFSGVSDQSHFLTDTFAATLPAGVKAFVFLHLTNMQAPGFDTFVFLVVMAFSLFSAAARALSANPTIDEHVPLHFVATEYLKMAGGLFVALLLVFAASEIGESHN